MNTITLKQLRYFDAVARHLHFGRAADACCITQPALSMQILELERSLDTTLIERARTGLKLTASGEALVPRARRILLDVEDLVATCATRSGVLASPLRLGVIPTLAPYLLPPLLAVIQERHPTLHLHVRETQTRPLIEELLDGRLDVLVMALPVDASDVTTLPLFDDRFFLATPASRMIEGQVRATSHMLANERLLLLEEGHCLRDQALSYCSLQQVNTLNTLGVSTLSTVAGMVAAGHGITLLPEICLEVETKGRAIAITRFVAPEPVRTIGLAWRATSPRSADFHALADMLLVARSQVTDHIGDVAS
jgi:LysR family transcriptional regulator, hydrogen peroxide-inducible genes activator